MSEGAYKVSGISDEFLRDKPKFKEVYKDFLTFISNSPLIAHNAQFDVGFLNSELSKILSDFSLSNEIIDTLSLAKKKYPGAQASLDALCKRFEIDTSKREKHGALLDAYLLVDVYIELIGGKQTSLALSRKSTSLDNYKKAISNYNHRKFKITAQELEEHKAIINKIDNPIWSEN